MPTNVPPQYREAEDRFRRASSIQERIAALQEMLAIMPKHKGTDHLKAQLRSRLSKLMAELEKGSSKGGGGRTEPFSMPKEGGGRATLIGPTNVGKSLLLNKSTGARSRVGAYELSTQEPVPGMLSYEDVRVQLVDTPPITNPSTQGRLYGLLRNSDVFVAVVDLSMDGVAQADEVFSALGDWSFRLLNKGEAPPADANPWLCKPLIVVANKADIPGALDQYEAVEDRFAARFPVVLASAEEEVGFDDLSREIFEALNVIRVYAKSPRVRVDDYVPTEPIILPVGSTVMDAATHLHKDLARGLRYATLWGASGKFDGQRVGRAHELADRDIIEVRA